MDIQSWIRDLPKAEHHLHIEGTIPWDMVRGASDATLPEQPAWLAKAYRFDDFTDFEKAIGFGIEQVIVRVEDYHHVAHHHFQKLAAQNVRYVETSFGLNIAVARGFAFSDVAKAILTAAPDNMTVRVFGAFHRGDIMTDELVQDALNTPDLAGIDLHGDERRDTPLDFFAEIYSEARKRGLRTKAHSGELRDSTAIMDVLEKLQPQRIQHGITATKDEKTLAHLAEQGIILDICPTSNIKLRVIPEMQSYPIRTLLEHGIELTINTDDPTIFACTLSGELLSLYEHKLLNPQEIVRLQQSAFARADMDNSIYRLIETELSNSMAKLEL